MAYQIKKVYHPDSSKAYPTEKVLLRSEKDLFELRRKLNPEAGEEILLCAVCYQRLRLVGNTNQTFYFRHFKDSEDCPEKVGSGLTIDEINRIKYNGQKEGRAHRENKALLAEILGYDPSFIPDSVVTEKTFRDENPTTGIARYPRRPDVTARHRFTQRRIAFELQVSTTYLDVVIQRENYYKEAGEFILWVFLEFNKCRFTELDIFYGNRCNAFVLDDDAKNASRELSKLILTCYYFTYSVRHVEGRWIVDEHLSNQLVSIEELTFDQETGKLFYRDCDALKLEAETTAKAENAELHAIKLRKKRVEEVKQKLEKRKNRQKEQKKGLNDQMAEKLRKIGRLKSLRCHKCGNEDSFRSQACFIYCKKCNESINY
ncbi:DUF6035 family protein [Motilimonas eburnea]|uniref:DUF6035 family protein n=1 Tax=Motilimonas eburnea TaxID=1737488 RepID=UPI001E289238|nr:DUF6035 family protein [Motilimonas eburnea]MCE2571858.1 DUF6035 family protein [Motilimonas eburnea]